MTNSITKESKDKNVRVEIREIENGFITRKNSEYKDADGSWQYETKEYFSKDDPLEINVDTKLSDLFE